MDSSKVIQLQNSFIRSIDLSIAHAKKGLNHRFFLQYVINHSYQPNGQRLNYSQTSKRTKGIKNIFAMNLFFEETKPNAFQKYHIPTATTKFSRKSLDISKILTFSILTQKFGTIKKGITSY